MRDKAPCLQFDLEGNVFIATSLSLQVWKILTNTHRTLIKQSNEEKKILIYTNQ